MVDCIATGDNPFCGDTITLRIAVEENRILESSWDGNACELCQETADRLVEEIRGKQVTEALALSITELLAWYGAENVGRTRRNCVQLPLTVLKKALQEELNPDSA
jgi:NifU-like protein involved in Fe-S cluster formation